MCTNFECLLYKISNSLFKFNETFLYNSNTSSLANLQRTVTNKKCKKLYTNRIIKINFKEQ